MKKSMTHVSDRALIRYLERVLLVDVEGLRNRIGRRADNAVKEGASATTVDGVKYVLNGKTMTNVVPNKRRFKSGRRQKK